MTTLAAVACLAVGTGCEGEPGPPGDPGEPGVTVTLSPGVLTVELGSTATIMAMSSLTAGETFTFATSDANVATVDASGTITPVAVGAAIIGATGDTSGAVAVAGVSVVEPAPGPVSFANDILPLFTEKDVWYTGGQACDAGGCHTGIGGAHDLDMGSHSGILLGADGGLEAILDLTDPGESGLRKRMRNNRMPWGISIWTPRNGPMVMETAAAFPAFGWTDPSSIADTNGLVKLVEAWLVAGAPNGTFDYIDSTATMVTKDFDADLLPLFTTDEVWEVGTEACNAAGCHTGVGGSHDLDMGSHAGILAGADGGAEPIIDMVDPMESGLRKRLRNNRMPWGMPTWVPRNGPNGEVLKIVSWIEDGALDN